MLIFFSSLFIFDRLLSINVTKFFCVSTEEMNSYIAEIRTMFSVATHKIPTPAYLLMF